MTIDEWLGTWHETDGPGKHDIIRPAYRASGYQFNPTKYDRIPRPVTYYSMSERVSRAIPVEGTVSDPEPSWMKSPQVRFWLEKPKKSLGERIMDWLRRPAG